MEEELVIDSVSIKPVIYIKTTGMTLDLLAPYCNCESADYGLVDMTMLEEAIEDKPDGELKVFVQKIKDEVHKLPSCPKNLGELDIIFYKY